MLIKPDLLSAWDDGMRKVDNFVCKKKKLSKRVASAGATSNETFPKGQRTFRKNGDHYEI